MSRSTAKVWKRSLAAVLTVVASGLLLYAHAKTQPVGKPRVLAPREQPLDLSIIQLIANPQDFHGKFIRVIGFVNLEFEGDAIYLSQEDYIHGLSKNGLWLDTNDAIEKQRGKFTKKYVLVEGTFAATDRGRISLFSGSIGNIQRFEVWKGRE